MIAHLKGTVIKKSEKNIILSVGNVGYLIHLSIPQIAEVEESSEREFFIHSQIREDVFDLYGFVDYQDLSFFKKLININGVGPKVAMEALSVPREKLAQSIEEEDIKFIQKIPGIGQKGAKRIILELKGKINFDNAEREHGTLYKKANEEAVDALTNLGYNKPQILKVLDSMPEKITRTEEIITYFLKNN